MTQEKIAICYGIAVLGVLGMGFAPNDQILFRVDTRFERADEAVFS